MTKRKSERKPKYFFGVPNMERKLDLNELFETFVKYIGLFCNNENIKDQNQI